MSEATNLVLMSVSVKSVVSQDLSTLEGLAHAQESVLSVWEVRLLLLVAEVLVDLVDEDCKVLSCHLDLNSAILEDAASIPAVELLVFA